MRRVRLTVAALCLVAALGLLGVQRWVDYITAAGPPRGLWGATLPEIDLGVDVWPATPGQGGYLEVWAYPHNADDVQVLVQLPGAPALPLAAPVQPPAPRLGELWT